MSLAQMANSFWQPAVSSRQVKQVIVVGALAQKLSPHSVAQAPEQAQSKSALNSASDSGQTGCGCVTASTSPQWAHELLPPWPELTPPCPVEETKLDESDELAPPKP